MTQEKLEKVFNRFENVMDTGRGGSSEGGVGIGLAIVRELVDLHGGSVHIASQEGQGTTVSVRFPVTQDQDQKNKESVAHQALPLPNQNLKKVASI